MDIEAIKRSRISSYVCFYNSQTPQDIAEAIRRVDMNKKYDSRVIVEKLDMDFTESLKNILLESDNKEFIK